MLKIITCQLALSFTSLGSYKYFDKQSIETYPQTLKRVANEINAMNTTWTAEFDPRFENHTKEDMKSHMGLITKDSIKREEQKQRQLKNMKKWSQDAVEIESKMIPFDQLPKNFDSRERWPKCKTLFDVRDQSRCGSCWAVAAGTVMSARLCIHSGQKDQRKISADDIMSCCKVCGTGCQGGQEDTAFAQWVERGFVTGGDYWPFPVVKAKSCKPYPFPMCMHHADPTIGVPDCIPPNQPWFETPQCKHECVEGYNKSYWNDIVRGRVWYTISGEEDIMREIATNGPVTTAIDLKDDFFIYKSGVYHTVWGASHGGHAVVITGYGEENGEKYWLIQNEWNTHWGADGYIKLRRGTNELGVEDDVASALPDLYWNPIKSDFSKDELTIINKHEKTPN